MGRDPHSFAMLVSTDGRLRSVWSAPPACPDHEHGKVARFGTYGQRTAHPRQRYRCIYGKTADGENLWHTFTPALPRDHVHEADRSCAECEQLRGVHHGDTAVARRHAWPTRVVARGLDQLAMGASYADVSRWALRTAEGRARGRHSTPAPPDEPKRKPLPRSTASPDVWHIAADWVEAFGPVVWAPVEQRLRAAALAQREANDAALAAGGEVRRPQVLLLDDVPVYARDRTTGKSRRDAGFYLLVAAEVTWRDPAPRDPDPGPITEPPAPEPVAHLRLVRAMAKSNTAAWRLVFDELGYAPEFVVADAGRGQLAAVRAHYASAGTVFVPSVWHLTEAVKEALADTPGALVAGPAGKELPGRHRRAPAAARPGRRRTGR